MSARIQVSLNQKRRSVLLRLLRDRCQIYLPHRPVNESGVYGDYVFQYLIYDNSPYIPCRFDVARYYRTGDVQGIETIVSDFEVYFPQDLSGLTAECRIVFNGDVFEVRKLMDNFTDSITQSAIVAKLETPNYGIETP